MSDYPFTQKEIFLSLGASRELVDDYKLLFSTIYESLESLKITYNPESSTSRLLHGKDVPHGMSPPVLFRMRANQELSEEFIGVIRGTHAGTFEEEATQGVYWTFLGSIFEGFKYDQVNPHLGILKGYAKGLQGGKALDVEIKEFLVLEASQTLERINKAMEIIGKSCRKCGCLPHELATYEIETGIKTKPYLVTYYNAEVSSAIERLKKQKAENLFPTIFKKS